MPVNCIGIAGSFYSFDSSVHELKCHMLSEYPSDNLIIAINTHYVTLYLQAASAHAVVAIPKMSLTQASGLVRTHPCIRDHCMFHTACNVVLLSSNDHGSPRFLHSPENFSYVQRTTWSESLE